MLVARFATPLADAHGKKVQGLWAISLK